MGVIINDLGKINHLFVKISKFMEVKKIAFLYIPNKEVWFDSVPEGTNYIRIDCKYEKE